MAKRSGSSIVLRGDDAHRFFAKVVEREQLFTATDGQKCDRCGETWGRANNTPNAVYHLCLVPDASVKPLGCMCTYKHGENPQCPWQPLSGVSAPPAQESGK